AGGNRRRPLPGCGAPGDGVCCADDSPPAPGRGRRPMTDRSDLIALVERLSGARVLCVGDAMLDRFVHGEVERISPEAPIPVLRVRRETAMLGGGGNVARNLS